MVGYKSESSFYILCDLRNFLEHQGNIEIMKAKKIFLVIKHISHSIKNKTEDMKT